MTKGMHAWFEAADRMRRLQGLLLDSAQLGQQQTPHRVIHAWPGLRLRHYPANRPGQASLLILAAPIKRHYIWDLFPERSVVRRAMAGGLEVYLLEWTDQELQGGGLGLEDYAGTVLDECLDAIAGHGPSGGIFLAGHSLGGTLAALYSAWKPQRVAGLVLLEAPLHFAEASGAFGPFLALGIPARALVPASGRVPGSLLNLISVGAAPDAFVWERYLDRLVSMGSTEALTHWRVERWTLDEFALPPRLFEDVVEWLYRRDMFMRGELAFGGKPVAPRNITAPLFAVYDPSSRVVPPESVVPFHRAAGSRTKELLAYRGDVGVALQHVGVLVGESAHRELWPKVLRWLGQLPSQGRR